MGWGTGGGALGQSPGVGNRGGGALGGVWWGRGMWAGFGLGLRVGQGGA